MLSSSVKENHFILIMGDTLYQIGPIQNTSIWFSLSNELTGGITGMNIDVRLAGAQDRSLIEEFYVREGKNFQQLILHSASTPVGASSETMFVIAVTRGMVVAALKLDIAEEIQYMG